MLLDEDPATLIHHTISNFNIQADKQAVARINDSLGTLSQARDLRIREAESALRKLSRNLTSLNNHYEETVSTHSSTAHASQIATLDTQKFRVAKTASDLEIESERLSSQLADLQARLQELESQGVDGGENSRRTNMDDEAALKLAFYRSLGMEISRGEDGEYKRVVIANTGKRDVNILDVNPKLSRMFCAKFLWERL